MGWYYRDPMSFPAKMLHALQFAHATPDEWQLIGAYRTLSEAKSEAERFRWLRWCIKSKPGQNPILTSAVTDAKWRSSIDQIDGQFYLYVRSTANIIDELIRLNPELVELINRECQ